MKIQLVAILCALPILASSQNSPIQVGIGYQDGWTLDVEAKINKSGDELRTFFYRDYYAPINKFALLFQPLCKPFVGQLLPMGAFGFSVGYWRSRKRGYYPTNDGTYSENSHWKKNPVISLTALAGLEYGTGRFAIDAYCLYSVDIAGNQDWSIPRFGTTLKFRL